MEHSFHHDETIEFDDDEAVSNSSIAFTSNGGEPLIRLLLNKTSNFNHEQNHKTRYEDTSKPQQDIN